MSVTRLPSKPRYFPELTGFRAVAAFLVFFHHCSPVGPESWLHPLFREGHIGVTMFFVLSGFLIAYRYPWLHEKRSLNPFVERRFWQYCANRVARIWPIYMLLTIGTFCIRGTTDVEQWITNLTFVRGYSERLKFTGIAAGWSLTVEETFYFIAPVLFAILADIVSSLTRDRGFSRPGATRIAIFVCSIFLALLGNALVTFSKHFGWSCFETHRLLVSYTFLGRSFEFLCGFYAAQQLRYQDDFEIASTSRIGPRTYVSGAAFVLMTYVLSRLQMNGQYKIGMHHPCGPLITNLLMPPAIAALIYSLVTEKTWAARFLGSRLMVQLGLGSYCFYLLHYDELHRFFRPRLWDSLFCTFVALNVISWICHKTIEEPLNRGIRWLYSRLAGPEPIEPSAVTLRIAVIEEEEHPRLAA